MLNWFKWLKEHCTLKLKAPLNINTPFTPTTQEDPRTLESIKRTRKAFKQQETAMNMRAMKAHAADCKDVLTCIKERCFIREPDKIVKSETVSAESYNKRRKKNMKLLREMNKKLS